MLKEAQAMYRALSETPSSQFSFDTAALSDCASQTALAVISNPFAQLLTSTEIITRVAYLLCPALLMAAAVFVLRPCFAFFLRQAAHEMINTRMPKSMAEAAGHYLALFNVTVFITTWLAMAGSVLFGGPFFLTVGLALAGVFAALIVTVRVVTVVFELPTIAALVVGLVIFAGGNLAFIIAVPTICLLC